MSYDFVLQTENEELGWWNYTYNIATMVDAAGFSLKELDSMSGFEGSLWLKKLVSELEAHPETYKKFNPWNSWGDYDSFVTLLKAMSRAVPEAPCVWRVL